MNQETKDRIIELKIQQISNTTISQLLDIPLIDVINTKLGSMYSPRSLRERRFNKRSRTRQRAEARYR